MKCKYCGAEFDGNLCPKCGAKAENVNTSNFKYPGTKKTVNIRKSTILFVLLLITSFSIPLIGSKARSKNTESMRQETHDFSDNESNEPTMSQFKEDWYLYHNYYIDSNGNYFKLKHSDTFLQINIADVGKFNVEISKYKIDNDNEYGNAYVYYDKDSYVLVKYYPQLNNTIKIETESGEITCTNISEEEYLEAERNYANSQLEGFEEDWYKGKYLSSYSYGQLKEIYRNNAYVSDGYGYIPINFKQINDTSDVFILEVAPVFNYMSENVTVDFLSDEYKIDYENYGYIYESTNLNGVIIYLEYFPKDKKVRVYDEHEIIGGTSVAPKSYTLLTEENVEELYMINKEKQKEE